jgi:hypothetical protein
MSRGFKTNDEVFFAKSTESRDESLEAVIVICKFKRLNKGFVSVRDNSSEVIQFSDVDANINHGGKHLS